MKALLASTVLMLAAAPATAQSSLADLAKQNEAEKQAAHAASATPAEGATVNARATAAGLAGLSLAGLGMDAGLDADEAMVAQAPRLTPFDAGRDAAGLRSCLTEFGLLIEEEVDRFEVNLDPIDMLSCPTLEMADAILKLQLSGVDGLPTGDAVFETDDDFWHRSFVVLNYYLGGMPFTQDGRTLFHTYANWPVSDPAGGTVMPDALRVLAEGSDLELMAAQEPTGFDMAVTGCGATRTRILSRLEEVEATPVCRSVLETNGILAASSAGGAK